MNRKKKQHKCRSIADYHYLVHIFNPESAQYFGQRGLKELERERELLAQKGIKMPQILTNRSYRRQIFKKMRSVRQHF